MSIENKISALLEGAAQVELQESTVEAAAEATAAAAEATIVESTEVATEVAKESTEVKADAEVSLDLSEDVAALTSDETLTEEFKAKAATIFEAAVLSRVKAEVSRLNEEFAAKLEEAKEQQAQEISEGLVEKVDGYLSYMVEQWKIDNELALESGMKSEIMEGFVGGLKTLFEEHYIDIPEEKFDLVGSLEKKSSDLEAQLSEQSEQVKNLTTLVNEMKRNALVASISEGLTVSQSEKFKALAEEIAYEDEASFETKLQTIRESYFSSKDTTAASVVSQETSVDAHEVLSESIARYVKALNNI